MMKSIPRPTKRARRKFSLNDKKKLCEQWQASGLNKHQFCKQQDLVLTAFSKWCHKLLPNNIDVCQKDWAPVALRDNADRVKEPISVETLLPNKMILRLSLALSCLNELLKDLYHAAPIIR